jgi:putative aminopeptidase FrvX
MSKPGADIAGLLARLSDAHGLSGSEDDIAALLKSELDPLVDEVTIDKMGNVVGVRRGDSPTVMIAAHMDEIGLMISHIDDEGFLRFVAVGGWFDQTILGQRVLIRTKDGTRIPGVVGSRPPHLMDAEDRKKPIKLKDMFVDCGASNADEADAMGVEVGCSVTVDRELRALGKDLVTGKALDNRAGCVMMVAALALLKGERVQATVQAAPCRRRWGSRERAPARMGSPPT